MGFFDRIKKTIGLDTVFSPYRVGLQMARRDMDRKINALFIDFSTFDDEFFDNLEEMLVTSDISPLFAMDLVEELRAQIGKKRISTQEEFEDVFVETLSSFYDLEHNDTTLHIEKGRLNIILIVGVNGVGKTTTIAKLTKLYKEEGYNVALAAGDTFRAGAIEQLQTWGNRLDTKVIAGKEGSDPASVVFDGIKYAKANDVDLLICDTAGRLQNKKDLMGELEKIHRVIVREVPDAPHETLLVLDATTGQNALSQGKEFSSITNVSGIVLTKMDGSAKGGIALSLRYDLDIPIKKIGLGEKAEDLAEFNLESYLLGIFGDETHGT